MIQINDKIISLDIFEKHFVCDLKSCKGACCVEGESGAPLLKEEVRILKKNFKVIKTYMNKDGVDVVEEKGVGILDQDNDLTTPLIKNKE